MATLLKGKLPWGHVLRFCGVQRSRCRGFSAAHLQQQQPPTYAASPCCLGCCRLRQQMQWRYGCSPSDSACCMEVPADSYITTQWGIRGLIPQSESDCSELPGCTAAAYCWPAWGADTCQSINNGSACQADRSCQVGPPAVGSALWACKLVVRCHAPHHALTQTLLPFSLCLSAVVSWERRLWWELHAGHPDCQVPPGR